MVSNHFYFLFHNLKDPEPVSGVFLGSYFNLLVLGRKRRKRWKRRKVRERKIKESTSITISPSWALGIFRLQLKYYINLCLVPSWENSQILEKQSECKQQSWSNICCVCSSNLRVSYCRGSRASRKCKQRFESEENNTQTSLVSYQR